MGPSEIGHNSRGQSASKTLPVPEEIWKRVKAKGSLLIIDQWSMLCPTWNSNVEWAPL